jgi:5-methyltetrahydropteroyltriglutamate--homocysteine methyltransferase
MIATNNGAFPWRGSATGEALESARAARRSGASTIEELRAVQDRATREAIEAQVRAGLALVTDGLVRREDPTTYLVPHLEGMRAGAMRSGFPGSGGPYTVPLVEAEVSWKAPILLEDYLFAREDTPVPLKIVLIGPYTLARLAEDRAYGEPLALAMALAAALNQEVRALQAAGAACVQIDEPALPAHAADFPLFTRVWEVLSRGITTDLHLHLQGGTLEGLYPAVTRLKRMACLSVDCLSAAGTLDLIRTAPPPAHMRLALGLVDGRSPEVETAEGIAALVGDPAALPPPDRLLLGTASDLGDLELEIAAAKLRSLSEAARLVALRAGPA